MERVRDAFPETEIPEELTRLGDVGLLRERLPDHDATTPAEMVAIADQALEMLSSYYVHLPLKRALYGADPELQLRILRNLASESPPDGADFHRAMAGIFASLRDLHTCYTLPEPYRRLIAFLPFMVESCVDEAGDTHYLVTKTAAAFADAAFARGAPDKPKTHVEVTHWNGMPIARAVALNAERCGGSNAAARHARGLERLTFRWLGRMPAPDEDWVIVTYRVGGGEPRSLRFPWLVLRRPDAAPAPGAPSRGDSTSLGLDEEGDWILTTKRDLYRGRNALRTKPMQPADGDIADVFGFTTISAEDGRVFGYLRIYAFTVEHEQLPAFDAELRNALSVPTEGLIIDIRSNPGGEVEAAEHVLQAISPVEIESEIVEFINTPAALDLATRYFEKPPAHATQFKRNRDDAVATGAQFVLSLPLAQGQYEIAQAYQGPLVLIVDSLSFSAADIFAAGFADHGLGATIGTEANTGGGGGNIWSYDLLRELNPALPEPVGTTSLDVAVRRTRRVGRNGGSILEDRGVVVLPENVTPLTAADVLGTNAGLMEAAIGSFGSAAMRPRSLAVEAAKDRRSFEVTCSGLERVDVYVDERPTASITELDGQVVVPVPAERDDPTSARFAGFPLKELSGNPVVTVVWTADGS